MYDLCLYELITKKLNKEITGYLQNQLFNTLMPTKEFKNTIWCS